MTTVPNDTIPAAPMPNAVTDTGQMRVKAWAPNKEYHRQETWPPHDHPLSSLFHNARLQWPANMDSRFQYERLVDWLATLEAVTDTGQMRVEAVARALHESCSRQDIDGYLAAKIDCTVLAQVVLATLEADAGREEVERLRKARDECERQYQNQVQSTLDQMLRAEATEAKLAALSQPAPVVEDEKVREEVERLKREAFTAGWDWARTMSGINFTDEPAPVVEDGKAREGSKAIAWRIFQLNNDPDDWCITTDAALAEQRRRDGHIVEPLVPTPAPEGQNAEASLRVALEWYADQFCELGPADEACGKLAVDGCSGCRARAALAQSIAPAETAEAFPQPDRNRAGKEPCGECYIHAGETCGVCGASRHDD